MRNSQEEYLSTNAVAEYFNVAVKTVRAWIKKGKLPAIKKKGNYHILKEDIEKLSLKEKLEIDIEEDYSKELKITGNIAKIIKNKKNRSIDNYVLLLNNATLIDKDEKFNYDNLWIPFSNKRLLGEFFKYSGTNIFIKVNGEPYKKKTGYKLNYILDIIDNENEKHISNSQYLKQLLEDKNIVDVRTGDIYYKEYGIVGFIYKVDLENNEVKMEINGLYEWWNIDSELGRDNIYRFNNFLEFRKFVDAAVFITSRADEYLDRYKEINATIQ